MSHTVVTQSETHTVSDNLFAPPLYWHCCVAGAIPQSQTVSIGMFEYKTGIVTTVTTSNQCLSDSSYSPRCWRVDIYTESQLSEHY